MVSASRAPITNEAITTANDAAARATIGSVTNAVLRLCNRSTFGVTKLASPGQVIRVHEIAGAALNNR
jgi:hypothetical protein